VSVSSPIAFPENTVMNQTANRIAKTRQQSKVHIEELFDAGTEGKRGILRWPPREGKFCHLRRLPTPSLTPWIERYWMVTWDLQQPCLQETLPHPSVLLIFENGTSVVHGVSTGRFSRVLEGRSGVFGVKFRPGGFRPFLKSSVGALLNRGVPATDVFGPEINQLEALWNSSSSSENIEKLIETSNAFFRARRPKPDRMVDLAATLVRKILETSEIRTVDDLVEQSGIGKRSLQRIFDQYVGVNPKWVIRRYRLHELVERSDTGEDLELAQVALELGYFDQSHLINDFKSIVGCSPTKYRRRAASAVSLTS
jgi:AraC-like DNA-binding protein